MPMCPFGRRQVRSLPTASTATSGALPSTSDVWSTVSVGLVATEQGPDLVAHQDRHDDDARDDGLDDHAAGREIEVCEDVVRHLYLKQVTGSFPDD